MRRKLKSAEIRSIARQILEALAAMHGKNLVYTGEFRSTYVDAQVVLLQSVNVMCQISNHKIYSYPALTTTIIALVDCLQSLPILETVC